jgi:hypothetical protein
VSFGKVFCTQCSNIVTEEGNVWKAMKNQVGGSVAIKGTEYNVKPSGGSAAYMPSYAKKKPSAAALANAFDCAGCAAKIVGGACVKTKAGAVYHQACFKCKTCAKVLVGGYMTVNAMVHCGDCGKKLRQKERAAAQERKFAAQQKQWKQSGGGSGATEAEKLIGQSKAGFGGKNARVDPNTGELVYGVASMGFGSKSATTTTTTTTTTATTMPKKKTPTPPTTGKPASFCSNCGSKRSSPAARFCSSCGTAF